MELVVDYDGGKDEAKDGAIVACVERPVTEALLLQVEPFTRRIKFEIAGFADLEHFDQLLRPLGVRVSIERFNPQRARRKQEDYMRAFHAEDPQAFAEFVAKSRNASQALGDLWQQ